VDIAFDTARDDLAVAVVALGKLDQRMMKTSFSSILRLLELTASTFVAST